MNGDYFLGHWRNSEPINGKMLYLRSGAVYDGEWGNNTFNGFGIFTTGEGESFEGYWTYGKPHGYGRASITIPPIISDGDMEAENTQQQRQRYDEETKEQEEGGEEEEEEEGEIETKRERRSPELERRQGKRQGRRQGKSCFGIYTGLWSHGKRHGEGLMVLDNLDRYHGRWESDLPHGEGVYWSKIRATVVRGTWYRGELVDYSIQGEESYFDMMCK